MKLSVNILLPLTTLMSLFPMKDIKPQGDSVLRNLTVQVQLFKSDSSLFNHQEAWVNIWGNDVNDPDNAIVYAVDPVDASGYVEFNFDLWTPRPNSVVDYNTGILPEDYAISMPYPLPVNNRTRFDVSIPERTGAVLSLYDVKGERIYSEQMDLESAVNVVELSGVEHLPPGVYFVSITGADNNFLLSGKFVRMDENNVYRKFLSKSSSVPVSGNYDFNVVAERPYVNPSPDRDDASFKSSSIDDDIVSDKIWIQWVVPGFDVEDTLRNLFENGEFQDTIYQEFLLPYPLSTPGTKFDPKNKSTFNVDKDYFQTNPGVNFNYKNDAKKD